MITLLPLLILASPAAEALDRQGRQAFRDGEFARAAEAFGTLLAQLPADDPLRVQTQYNRGRALQEAGQPCAASEALFAFISNPAADERRRGKAKRALSRTRTDCQTLRLRDAPDEAPPPPPTPSEVSGRFLLLAGLASGAIFGAETTRARTVAGLGAGWQQGALLGDVEARLSVENPDADADPALLVRPGLRVLSGDERFFLRVATPILLTPVTALGLGVGGGARFPARGDVAAVAELGGIYWLADPGLFALDARLGVDLRF